MVYTIQRQRRLAIRSMYGSVFPESGKSPLPDAAVDGIGRTSQACVQSVKARIYSGLTGEALWSDGYFPCLASPPYVVVTAMPGFTHLAVPYPDWLLKLLIKN